MKVRKDFVTNSSSSSFVVSKKDIGEDKANYIEEHFDHVTSDELLEIIEDFDVYRSVYFLVDYKPEDEYMHIWVRRDEYMDDNYIDDVLWDNDLSYEGGIEPKFEYHF